MMYLCPQENHKNEHNMKKLFLSMMLLTLPLVVSAYDIAVENDDGVTIYYNLLLSAKHWVIRQ